MALKTEGVGMFYVYVHRRKDDGSVFYIGKGRDQRAWSIKGRTAEWLKIAANHGREVSIVADGMTESMAYMLEGMLILLHRQQGAALVNVQASRNVKREYKNIDNEVVIEIRRSSGNRKMIGEKFGLSAYDVRQIKRRRKL